MALSELHFALYIHVCHKRRLAEHRQMLHSLRFVSEALPNPFICIEIAQNIFVRAEAQA